MSVGPVSDIGDLLVQEVALIAVGGFRSWEQVFCIENKPLHRLNVGGKLLSVYQSL